jgi:ribosomal protein S18 acetylase RimI-like enzyme
MPHLEYLPISRANRNLLISLMNRENQAYLSDLSWDNAPVQQILQPYFHQDLLPGFVAVEGAEALGYIYFLVNENKGIIGTIYARAGNQPQRVAEGMLTLVLESLKKTAGMRRIEAQTMPFHGVNLTAAFTRHGFQYYERYFLELDLVPYSRKEIPELDATIIPWNSAHFSQAAAVIFKSYQGQTDALLCEDYHTISGCEGYLHSLIDNPGCGIFVPEASFMGLDGRGRVCGFLISSRISNCTGMIPQIASVPDHQGHGVGSVLLHRALSYFKSIGCRTVGLTVTKKNRRAFEWYKRVGFRIKKEFGAYVWERT